MSKYSQVYNIAYLSPFEATNLFAYLNYTSTSANPPYSEARQVAGRAAAVNIANDIISPLGCYYAELIHDQIPLNTSLLASDTVSLSEAPEGTKSIPDYFFPID